MLMAQVRALTAIDLDLLLRGERFLCSVRSVELHTEFWRRPLFGGGIDRAVIGATGAKLVRTSNENEEIMSRYFSAPEIDAGLDYPRLIDALSERLRDLVEYAAKRLQSESLENPTWETFECVVDRPEARACLEENRPEVVAGMKSLVRRSATPSWRESQAGARISTSAHRF